MDKPIFPREMKRERERKREQKRAIETNSPYDINLCNFCLILFCFLVFFLQKKTITIKYRKKKSRNISMIYDHFFLIIFVTKNNENSARKYRNSCSILCSSFHSFFFCCKTRMIFSPLYRFVFSFSFPFVIAVVV